jgi:hypothetical protein
MKNNFDINILQNFVNNIAKAPIDERKMAGEFKTLPTSQNLMQGQNNAIQTMKELSLGIKAGKDPYPLLLQAVKIISSLIGDKGYYNVHRDIIQGMGQMGSIPAEWQREAQETDLQSLEAVRRNIDTAIELHKKTLEGQTVNHKEAAYIIRVRNSFGIAYKFFDKHKYARTDEDWGRVAANVPNDIDPLTIDLIVAVLRELERESNEFKGVTA